MAISSHFVANEPPFDILIICYIVSIVRIAQTILK